MNHNHPPKSWLQLVWKYLGKHFTTAEDLQRLEDLPLVPLSMSHTPISLMPLCYRSRVVVKDFNYDCIDDAVSNVLRKIGLIVMLDFPAFIRHHPALLGTFINPPTIQGVLRAMVVCVSNTATGTLVEKVRGVSTQEKETLRSFLSDVRPGHIGMEEYNLLGSLPLFETQLNRFVSKKDDLCAASPDSLPIQPLRDLIDVSKDDSKALARSLKVRILNPTELLCEMIFPDMQQGRYSEEQVDRLMPHVLKRFGHVIRSDANFKRNIKVLPFVPSQTVRVRASDVFDPRNRSLQELFAHEDVFPVGELYNDPDILIMLEELGMKRENKITAKDLFKSAKEVSALPLSQSVMMKSKAIMQYISIHPRKLQEPAVHGKKLGALLWNLRWVSRLRQRTRNFPPSLPWWETAEEEDMHFFKPSELKGNQLANLIGTVTPVVDIESSNEICSYFGWQTKPAIDDVVKHLRNVVTYYTKAEKLCYMEMVEDIYMFFCSLNYEALKRAFERVNVVDWVWNGDGFSSPCKVLPIESTVDLSPYILPLPWEMMKFSALFQRFGMRSQSDSALLLQVLGMIKEKYDETTSRFSSSEVKRDLKLSVEILNEVADEQLSPELQEKILFPTHMEDNSFIRLERVERCMYCEHDDWLKREGDDEELEYFYVHANVPTVTAERLGVPSLPNRMLDADEFGEEFGQEEKLTTRLNRLLEDYKDGFAVPKELVQNADDAGATEVRFLYDERTNEDAMTCLIDEKMRGCQGPALWVYNDAIFTDEDFLNITKLNEATKAHDTAKIGRFGLGFNAVYNLTDVPMFVSRNYFAVFDPHRKHLGKAIRNKGKSGMKINVNKAVKRLRKYNNQFKPFNGIFGCDLNLCKEDNSFDGTLFRFPLRTRNQAIASEIKQLYYDDQQMRELLQMFLHGAKHLLLFTQNVLRVGIYHLPKLENQDPQPVLMFEVTKSTPQAGILRELSFSFTLPPTALNLSPEELSFLKQCNFLQASSKMKRLARDRKIDPRKFPISSMIVDVNCSFTKYGMDFFDGNPNQEKITWLVVSSMGNGQAMNFAKNDPSLLPSAGVAVQLKPRGSSTFEPLPVVKTVDGFSSNGTIFCYLPLPIHSGLSVHINGAFAVASNRRNLQEKVEDDKTCFGVDWNKVLLQDSVVSAFLDLLEDMKTIIPNDGSYVFHSLWPKESEVQPNCLPLLTSFYAKLAGGDFPLFSDGERWVGVKQIVFLDPHFREESQTGEAANKVLQMCFKGRGLVIDLPFDVFRSLQVYGQSQEMNARGYSKIRFFREIFFPNLLTLPPYLRDVLTLHALDANSGDLNQLIKLHACIPTSPSGNTLQLPQQLVHPYREVASLFAPEDGRFPFGTPKSYLSFQRLARLEQLGMASNDLPWSEVAERAESIHNLNDSDAALRRGKALLSFMEKKIKFKSFPDPTSYERITKAKFLPVLKKPTDFPLVWKGDEFEDNSLLAPEEAYLEEQKYLVCCTEPLVGISISRNVKKLLTLDTRGVTLEQVIQQLTNAFSAKVDSLNSLEYKELQEVFRTTYGCLQQSLSHSGDRIFEALQGKRFILDGKRFLSAQQVAFSLPNDCSPYLFKLPQWIAEWFGPLMKAAGVKMTFVAHDYFSSLREIKGRFGGNALDEQTLQVATRLAVLLGEAVKDTNFDLSGMHENLGVVYLPDSKGLMTPVSDLCIRDCPWMPDEEGVQFVNDRISLAICRQLCVRTRRQEALRPHLLGIPFGQREKLTNRLKRILTGYPCEKEILKELLQNADDAQATEIFFIKDPRHHPDGRVFEDSWKPLQGPALCVYNNKPFTKADIEGIHNLGEGSKGEDPNKTGQYGVGFNAVYHLTDVPSFMSKGNDIGDVLCAFDPHCKYVPGATIQEPGIMLQNITTLKSMFPDVFPCYLQDHFSTDNGTMFRFPLRTREMAMVSQISSSPVTLSRLDTLMEDLKKELFEVLLFVNNVNKITLCEVNDKSGRLTKLYSVEATMSKEDEAKRRAFANKIKQIGETMKREKDLLPSDIQVARVSYVLKIADNLGNEEKWLIVQQIGFEKKLNSSITNAFKKHELGMLPRGGVACLLETKSRDSDRRGNKVYCFLPLPFETDLPVHINGHFALDHEARRNLWRDEAGGYRSDWNNALLRDVVASCYLTLLDEVRTFLHLPIAEDGTPCVVMCTENEILQRIRAYERFFPLIPPTEPYWKTLVDTVYQEINLKGLKLLPVVRKTPLDVTQQVLDNTSVVEITWFPPTGHRKSQAFFNNLAETEPFVKVSEKKRDDFQTKARTRFEEILLESGFNLLAFSTALNVSFQRSQVPTCAVSPMSVVDFYKSISSQEPLCKIGQIPCNVNATPFRDALGVVLMLLYCKGMEHFFDQLPGLPMLLTQDNCLQLFSSKDPKFFSRFKDILPGSPQVFLNELVYQKLFSDEPTLKSSVLRPLDAEGFTQNLPQTLPRECYEKGAFVQWSPDQKTTPNQRWISRVWVFLGEITRDILDDPKIAEDSRHARIKAKIGSLANWSILPANNVKIVQKKKSLLPFVSSSVPQPAAQFLVPLCKASSVLDYGSPDASNFDVVEVLRKLGVLELNYAMLSTLSSGMTMYSSSNGVSLARLMVSSLKSPTSLLTALDEKIEMDRQSPEKLKSADCKVLLEYFSRSVSSLKETDGSKLRKLPFYPATHGGFIRLDQHPRACVLPIEVPRIELEVLERELDVVFLESWESLSRLFKFFALECVTAEDVYCTWILPNLHIFSQDARESHLEYIRTDILSNPATSEDDMQRLLDCFRHTPFIPSADGSLKTASSFYDPCVEVFTTMLSPNNFPPKPLDSIEWLNVLRRIGLVGVVSQDHFKGFAREVAREAATEPTGNTRKKSQVLVKYLIRRPNVVAEGLLQAVCDIRFVASDPVKKDLQDLCQPWQATTNGQSSFCAFKRAAPSHYAEIVWTKTHLLPSWADPTHRKRELGCPPGTKIDQYCNAFIAQLQIMKTPSVDLVIDHCQTICFHLGSKNERENSSPRQCDTKIAVMECIYEFLQSQLITSNETTELLSNTPCILVEKGKKFILPSQAVLDLYDYLEIKPFLYRVPLEFGKFHPLFQRIGCNKHVTISHYTMVLKKLYEKCKSAKLHPNEVIICVKAEKGFFEQLENKVEEVKSLLELHLPGIPSQRSFLDRYGSLSVPPHLPVTMHESSKLIFNDQSPDVLDRLQKFQHHLLLDLRKMNVTCHSTMTNYRELLMKLPTTIRPKMLSSVVDEKLSDSQSNVLMASEDVTLMKQRLSSPQFFSGLVRLIRDENSHNKYLDEAVIRQIKNGLQGIEICAVSNLKTILFYDGNPIPESEAKVPYFLEKRTTSGGEMRKLYLDAVAAMADKSLVISWVSHVIVELYGDLLGKKAGLIFQILNCPPSGVRSLLDSLKVRPDDSNCEAEVDIFPNLGTFIPLDEHHLLNDAFEEFEPGEYVGYELEDPSLDQEDGVATYIYARIVKEVTAQDRPLFARRYTIDIGGNQEKDVDATDLYKFHRLESPSSSAVVVSDVQRQSSAQDPVQRPRSRNKKEVFDEISDLLEEAWKMPEDKRRKVIKRLYLRWHPDKNVGDEEFCNEVCKHLQSEMYRLERGEPRGSQQATNMGATGTQHGSYDDFFTCWGRRARQHHTQREGYRTRQPFRERTTRRPNPQPGEARRWFRQAEADIVAVENDITCIRPSYEWACFKCHQVWLTFVSLLQQSCQNRISVRVFYNRAM